MELSRDKEIEIFLPVDQLVDSMKRINIYKAFIRAECICLDNRDFIAMFCLLRFRFHLPFNHHHRFHQHREQQLEDFRDLHHHTVDQGLAQFFYIMSSSSTIRPDIELLVTTLLPSVNLSISQTPRHWVARLAGARGS